MKRGQGAMEFLMTYGWFILLVLVALSALYFLGVFEGSSPSVCFVKAPFVCTDMKVDEGGVVFILGNADVNSIEEVNIKINGELCEDVWIDNEYTNHSDNIRDKQTRIECVGVTLDPKKKASVDLNFVYDFNNFQHSATAEGSGMVEEGNRNFVKHLYHEGVLMLHMDGDASDSGPDNLETHINGDVDCTVEGRINQGCYFDGDQDSIWVDEEDLPNTFNEITISFWVKDWIDNAERILTRENVQTYIVTATHSEIDFRHSSVGDGLTTFILASPMVSDTWYHFVFTWDGAQTFGYVNAVELEGGEVAVGTIQYAGTFPLIIGNRNVGDPSPHAFSGILDEVFMFNLSLTQEEVLELYNSY